MSEPSGGREAERDQEGVDLPDLLESDVRDVQDDDYHRDEERDEGVSDEDAAVGHGGEEGQVEQSSPPHTPPHSSQPPSSPQPQDTAGWCSTRN